MPATEIFLVVATTVGAGSCGLIAWVTARRHSQGRRFEQQIETVRLQRPNPAVSARSRP